MSPYLLKFCLFLLWKATRNLCIVTSLGEGFFHGLHVAFQVEPRGLNLERLMGDGGGRLLFTRMVELFGVEEQGGLTSLFS